MLSIDIFIQRSNRIKEFSLACNCPQVRMASYARAAGSTCAQLTRRLLYSQETRLQQLGAQTSRQTRGFASGGY